MVTKHPALDDQGIACYILAKNHMVTKPLLLRIMQKEGYILAKNHMVTKPGITGRNSAESYILAKNHMVTKRLSFLICTA